MADSTNALRFDTNINFRTTGSYKAWLSDIADRYFEGDMSTAQRRISELGRVEFERGMQEFEAALTGSAK